MKTRRTVAIKPIIEDRTTKKITFGCRRKDEAPDSNEADLEFAKNCLRSANVQKTSKKLF